MDYPNYVGLMQSRTSPIQELAEVLLDRPLSEYVAEKRSARPQWSWRLIAEQLNEDTAGRVVVHGETLRQWYADDLAEVAS